uniref:Uncharacterized protein n=1 Tax=uncultured Poseidoniia archaeon TaxID=1697135 RepID=A0A1B1TAD3_9ARCH|nr:hypothetical protein [uncultured Candidatus Thalassoarchaea sp.]
MALLPVAQESYQEEFLFPKLMDFIAKTERIDGRDLFAPKSLGWMVGCIVMSMSLNWISAKWRTSMELMEGMEIYFSIYSMLVFVYF